MYVKGQETMKMKMAGKEHVDKAAAMLGYGPDAVMTGGARKRVGRKAETIARAGGVFMGPREGLEGKKERVSAAVKEEEQKEYKGKKGKGEGKENMLSSGPYPWIKEIDLDGGKVVYECEGKMYGREWSEGEGGKVKLGPKREVKEVKMYETV